MNKSPTKKWSPSSNLSFPFDMSPGQYHEIPECTVENETHIIEKPLDGTLMTKFPGEKPLLLKDKWRQRYCLLQRSNLHEFTISVFKSKSGRNEERGILCHSIALSESSSLLIKNEINKQSPFFRYTFAVKMRDGALFEFSSLRDDVRDQWFDAVHVCAALAKNRSLRYNTPSGFPFNMDPEECGGDGGEDEGAIDLGQEGNRTPSYPNEGTGRDDRKATGHASWKKEEGVEGEERGRPAGVGSAQASHHEMLVLEKGGNPPATPRCSVLADDLETNFPSNTLRLLPSPWRQRYSMLETDSNNDFVVLVYKPGPLGSSVDDRGTLKVSITLTATSSVLEMDEVRQNSYPLYLYMFALEMDNGKVYRFRSIIQTVRDTWVACLLDCVNVLERRKRQALPPTLEGQCSGDRRWISSRNHLGRPADLIPPSAKQDECGSPFDDIEVKPQVEGVRREIGYALNDDPSESDKDIDRHVDVRTAVAVEKVQWPLDSEQCQVDVIAVNCKNVVDSDDETISVDSSIVTTALGTSDKAHQGAGETMSLEEVRRIVAVKCGNDEAGA